MDKHLFDNTQVAFTAKSDKELARAYWLFKLIGSPFLVKFGKVMVQIALALRIPFGWALRKNIFHHFCGGESIKSCAEATRILDDNNVGTILDYSVEGKDSEEDFERTFNEILKIVETAKGNDRIPFCVFKVTGIARFALLEKVNRGADLSDQEKEEYRLIVRRIDAICEASVNAGTPLFIDAEESWIQDAIDNMVDSMMAKYNKEKAMVYNTAQLYRHDRLQFIKNSLEKARSGNYYLGLKLVRGAYMEKERDRAEEKGYPSPIQPDKESSDRDFDAALAFCVENIDRIATCCGTHNEQSCYYLGELLEKNNVAKDDKRIYFAQLFGMSDQISFNLANAGYNVAKYVPYGPIREVIPYLIRRAEENTSVKGQTSRELKLIQEERKRRKQAKS